jgi:hypothetical protein
MALLHRVLQDVGSEQTALPRALVALKALCAGGIPGHAKRGGTWEFNAITPRRPARSAVHRRLQRAAARRAGHDEKDDYDDESDEEWWSEEEEEVSSPIDAVDPFIYFAGESCLPACQRMCPVGTVVVPAHGSTTIRCRPPSSSRVHSATLRANRSHVSKALPSPLSALQGLQKHMTSIGQRHTPFPLLCLPQRRCTRCSKRSRPSLRR